MENYKAYIYIYTFHNHCRIDNDQLISDRFFENWSWQAKKKSYRKNCFANIQNLLHNNTPIIEYLIYNFPFFGSLQVQSDNV